MAARDRRRDGLVLIAVAVLLLALPGCLGPRRQTVYNKDKVRIQLVSERGLSAGYQHPLEIAPVRLAHILSRIDIRTPVKDGQQRIPAIPLGDLYKIADATAEALLEAKPHQQVAVYSVNDSKRFKIFDQNFLTSFIVYAKDDFLYIHLSRVEWKIPPRREDNYPDPEVGEHPMKFRILPGKAMEIVDQQSLAINWRDQVFAKPTRTRTTEDGRVVRRLILMESDEEEGTDEPEEDEVAPVVPVETIPDNLSPQALRELADLEDERLAGQVSEVRYRSRRREIFDRERALQAPQTDE